MVHTPAKLLVDLLQFRPHTFARRPALDGKVPLPVCPADVREAQKVERFGLAFPFSFLALFGIPPELDPARFVGSSTSLKTRGFLPSLTRGLALFSDLGRP